MIGLTDAPRIARVLEEEFAKWFGADARLNSETLAKGVLAILTQSREPNRGVS